MSEKPLPPYEDLAESVKKEKFRNALRQLGYYVPPYLRSIEEKVFLNSTFGAFGSRFKDGGIVETKPNQEKSMTLEELKSLKPGDRVRYSDVLARAKELVFIGIDPEQPTIALVRDVGNVNALIRAIHHSVISLMPPKPVEHVVEMMVAGTTSGRTHLYEIATWGGTDSLIAFSREAGRKATDATVTEDGLVLVKYINQPVEEAALLAAHKNPTKSFCSMRRSITGIPENPKPL